MTRDARRAVLLGWLFASAVLVLVGARGVVQSRFPDPDDAMRLMQVRDWLGGQSWWDVGQHRLWGGAFRMHWSRLVDLPLAAVIAVVRPLAGDMIAERTAMVAVPLLTLLVVMALAARIASLLGGEARAPLAVLLTALSPPIVYQMKPMRIDHHGWQVALALGAALALLLPPTRRTGAAIGMCLGTLVTVSLEGLPVTAAIMGVALLAWAGDDRRREQVLATVATLPATVVALHVATRGPGMLAPACDAIAPVWIAALAIVCAGAGATVMLAPRRWWLRIAGPAAAAAVAGLAAIRAVAPVCTRGPFATLDPLVYRLWYLRVPEGLPLWEQAPGWIAVSYALPLVGLAGSIAAWRASVGEARTRWAMMLALSAATLAISILIIRGAATANAFALPGAAWLLLGWLSRARAIGNPVARTAATAAALLAAAPGLAGSLIVSRGAAMAQREQAAASSGRAPCDDGQEIADLARLPAGRVFAPIDVTPKMIATTPHDGIGAGYHRNGAAIHRVLATFLGTPAAAEVAVRASGATWVAGCPGETETETYRALAPAGFWARLERGERFAWLRPVAIPGSPVLAWRVVPSQDRLPEAPRHP